MPIWASEKEVISGKKFAPGGYPSGAKFYGIPGPMYRRRMRYFTGENRYAMLNKPAGVITATEDKRQQTVLDLIAEQKRKDLFPVGRLDRDTEGLLLITNDGDLAHRLLSPKHHVDKTYLVQTDLPITGEDADVFAKGFQVDEELTAMPADLRLLPDKGPAWAYITIREGKFHQIKRMFQARGKNVVYLKRISMGTLRLDETLSPGEYRRLTNEELGALLALAGREQSD